MLRDSGFECAAWLWGPTARRVKPESLVGAGIAEAKSVEVAAVMAGSMAAISGWVGGPAASRVAFSTSRRDTSSSRFFKRVASSSSLSLSSLSFADRVPAAPDMIRRE